MRGKKLCMFAGVQLAGKAFFVIINFDEGGEVRGGFLDFLVAMHFPKHRE